MAQLVPSDKGGRRSVVEFVRQRLIEHEVSRALGGVEWRGIEWQTLLPQTAPKTASLPTDAGRRWPTLTDAKPSISNAGRRSPTPVRRLGGSRSIRLNEGSDYAQEQLCRTRQYLNNCATAGRPGPGIPAAAPDAKLQHPNAHRRPPTPESRSQNRRVTEATGIPALAHAA